MKDPTAQDLFRYAVIETQKKKMQQVRETWAGDVSAYQSRHFAHQGITETNPGTSSDDELVMENNWLFAFVDTLVANISPPNPATTIVARREELEDAAKLREALINDVFKREKMHAKMWRMVTRAAIYPRAFMKVVWNPFKNRPRIRILSPQYVFYDNTVEDWEDVRYVVEVTVLTETEFKARVGKKGKKGVNYRTDAEEGIQFKGYPDWLLKDGSLAENDEFKAAAESMKWVVVYEYYDFVENKFLHIAEGCNVPLFEGELPYWHVRNPYYMLTFNDNLEDIGGMSDAQLVRPSIQALNETTTLQLAYAQATIPKTIVHEGLIDDVDDFVAALEQATTPAAIIRAKVRQNAHVSQAIGHTPTPSMAIEFSRTIMELRELIEFILGIAAYQRGGLGHSDVATELALSDTAIRTRNSRRQKAVYDVIGWAAATIIGLYTQFLPEESEIPLRMGYSKSLLVTRAGMAMPELPEGDEEPIPDDVFAFDYEAQPFNAQEGNSVVQLKTLIEMLPVLMQNPYIDQYGLTRWLLELQHATKILMSEEEVQAAQQQAAGPAPGEEGLAEEAQMQGISPDVAETMAGNVVAGDGEQTVPSGMMGGRQLGGG